MVKLKTQKTNASLTAFLKSVENEQRRKDSLELLKLFKEVTKRQPKMWGDRIAGFGEYQYKSEHSIQDGGWPLTDFSPRKRSMTVYIMPGFSNYPNLIKKLGKHKSSVSCIYFNKLENIDVKILKQIDHKPAADMKKIYKIR